MFLRNASAVEQISFCRICVQPPSGLNWDETRSFVSPGDRGAGPAPSADHQRVTTARASSDWGGSRHRGSTAPPSRLARRARAATQKSAAKPSKPKATARQRK